MSETFQPVSEATVINMILRLGGTAKARRDYPVIAQGIARAASNDPLFPARTGAQATACILVACAWTSSRLRPYVRNGNRIGLFQIRPPSFPKVSTDTLLHPGQAALIAIDLIRTSVQKMARRPWEERLAWYLDLGRVDGPIPDVPSPIAIGKSITTMRLAQRIYKGRFAEQESGTDLSNVVEYEPRALPSARPRTRTTVSRVASP